MSTDSIAGTTVTTNLDSGEQTSQPVQPMSAQLPPGVKRILNPVTQRVIERAINEVLGAHIKQTKQFTADALHDIRLKVTELVKQRIGDDEIENVDIGLELSALTDIPFFFKVNVKADKASNHFMDVLEQDLAEPSPVKDAVAVAATPEKFREILQADIEK